MAARRPGQSAREGLERSCGAHDWVRGRGPVGGVELLRARFRGHAFARHRHDTYAIGVTEAGVQVFDYRGRVERSTPGQLEAITGLSRYDLARQFRTRYGTSPYRYSLMRRLDFARGRLHGGTPLVDVALSGGFADQAHFTRMFRSAYGVTPGRYARLRASERWG